MEVKMSNGILKSYERVLAVTGSAASLGSAIAAANAGLWQVAGVLGGLPAVAGAAWWIGQRGFGRTPLERREESRAFALSTDHEILLVGSGLSWFEDDLDVYRKLIDDGRRVALLCGTHVTQDLVRRAAKLGIEVRQIERERLRGFRGAIADRSDPERARVFMVEKRHHPVRGTIAWISKYRTRSRFAHADKRARVWLGALESVWNVAKPVAQRT